MQTLSSHSSHHHMHMDQKRRQRSSSGEMFSFPSTPAQDHQDSDFEFGCFTPESPSQDPYATSPADHLFFNGRLLPHAFPPQPAAALVINAENVYYRGTSRTSSVSSKDSFLSSRSNSTNSRSSSCSSARTSSSDNSDRGFLYYGKARACKATMATKMVTAQLYGASQRWQYITPVPAGLRREVSISRRHATADGVLVKEGLKRRKQGEEMCKVRALGPCQRFFRSFLLACRECHAMEPTRKEVALQGN